MTSDLRTLVVIDAPGMLRQLAKTMVYYASYLFGKPEANGLIYYIQILLCLNYEQLSKRLMEKSDRHTLRTPDTDTDVRLSIIRGLLMPLLMYISNRNLKGAGIREKNDEG